MFQRVLLDFVLKTFGLGAENEAKTNLSIHEIEMLKQIYELKHTVNK